MIVISSMCRCDTLKLSWYANRARNITAIMASTVSWYYSTTSKHGKFKGKCIAIILISSVQAVPVLGMWYFFILKKKHKYWSHIFEYDIFLYLVSISLCHSRIKLALTSWWVIYLYQIIPSGSLAPSLRCTLAASLFSSFWGGGILYTLNDKCLCVPQVSVLPAGEERGSRWAPSLHCGARHPTCRSCCPG